MLKSAIFKQFRGIATAAATTPATATLKLSTPPKYVLTSIRSFPSLEPHSILPVASTILGQPLRRDLLWRAVVHEADCARVGSSNPPSRSTNGYSRRKLHKQKGTGKARVGDANSPIRHNGSVAHGRRAPNDYSTKLPSKVYKLAMINALSQQYQNGKLFIIGGETKILESDCNVLDFKTGLSDATEQFIKHHKLQKLNLLFIIDQPRLNLFDSSNEFKEKIDIITKEEIEIRDVLKANRIYIEKKAFDFLVENFTI